MSLFGPQDKGGAPVASDPTVSPVVMAPPKPEKPYWYRDSGGKVHKTFEKIMVMRGAGHPDANIAKKLHTTEATVRQTVWLAKKNGWLNDEGEVVDIEAELAMDVERKIVRNISHSLDGGMTNWQTHEMTIAAAKGRGIFKNHEKSEGGSISLPVVAIRIEMPSLGASDQQIIEANVGGTPAYFEEGEIVNGIEERGTAACLPTASSSETEAGEPAEVLPAEGGR